MQRVHSGIVTLGLALGCMVLPAAEENWKPAPSPLKTRYAEHVSPKEIPLYEFYPRPLLARNHDGRNLAGLWDYAVTAAAVTQPPAEYQGRIMAPFPIESALSGVKRNVAANQKLWYRIAVEVPWGTEWLQSQNGRLMLRFGGVSGTATVFVNGKAVGSHQGSNDGFSFDVTDLVKEKGKHTLTIVVSATSVATPPGIQAATGIHKPAWIEAVRTSHIESLAFVPDVDASRVCVTPSGVATAEDIVEVIAYDRNFEVARASGKMGQELVLKIEKLRAWTPDRPFTYEYRATVTRGKQVLDSAFSLFAARKVSLGKDDNQNAVVLLNNRPVFLIGVLDAGWWPDGGATAPYVEAIRCDIEKIKQLGFNTVRKVFRTDQSQWYFWADRLGVTVLQELPPGDTRQLLREYPRIIAELFNHPSIVAWVLPAGIRTDAAEQLTAVIRKADPTRLVLGGPAGDIREIALADVERAVASKQATLLSPIGDIQAPLAGHAWTANAVRSSVDLTANAMGLAGKMATWKTKAGLSGFIYKQFADAGDDHSGLIAGDRQASKLDLEQMARANPPCFAVPQLARIVPPGVGPSSGTIAAQGHAEAGQRRFDVGLFDLKPQRDMRLPEGIKPIIDTWMRDTCVCVGPDGIYYLVGTGTTAPWKCDGIPLYRSADLKTWELVKVIVWRDQFQGTWLLKDRKNVSIWAPELHYIKGNYWLTFCTDWAREGGRSGTGFLKSRTGKVEGPYELVNTDGPITPGQLDASFFQDDDGTVYFLSGGSSIARMKDDMSGIAEQVRRVGTEGGGTVGFEGISLFKRNGTYYLSVTDCKSPYKTYDCMVGMSNNVYGPYRNVHIAVPHGGHNMFFKDKDGNWWSTLFGGDTPDVLGPLKEQPGLVRIEFAPDGTIHPVDPRLQ